MPPPDYSLIIPAYNEQAHLPATLDAARRAMATIPEHGELIVVDNNSTDTTAAIARAASATVVFEPINQISRARNAGARNATGRHLIFIDADTLISPPLLEQTLTHLAGGQCVGGGSTVAFDGPVGRVPRLILWAWTVFSSRFQASAAGCYVFCTREAFDAVGGFSEKVYASEELWFSRAIRRYGKRRGQRLLILPDHPVTTSTRKLNAGLHLQLSMLLCLIFPPVVFFRSTCGFWYKRPPPEASPARPAPGI